MKLVSVRTSKSLRKNASSSNHNCSSFNSSPRLSLTKYSENSYCLGTTMRIWLRFTRRNLRSLRLFRRAIPVTFRPSCDRTPSSWAVCNRGSNPSQPWWPLRSRHWSLRRYHWNTLRLIWKESVRNWLLWRIAKKWKSTDSKRRLTCWDRRTKSWKTMSRQRRWNAPET